jgi:hypothetical protein
MNPETQALINASKELDAIHTSLRNEPQAIRILVWDARNHVDKLLAEQLGREKN